MKTLDPPVTQMPRPEFEAVSHGAPLAAFTNRLASGRLWTVSAIAFAVFAIAFFTSGAPFSVPTVEATCQLQPLDVRFTSSAAEVHEFLTTCGPDGRNAYRSMQIADLFYPAVFGLFMATSLAATISRLTPLRPQARTLALLPFMGAAFDYLENVFAWSALRAFPSPAATDALLGLASAAKTTTFWLSGVLLILAAGTLGVRASHRLLGGRRHNPGRPNLEPKTGEPAQAMN